ncbi:uncharacterized protein LOC129598456 isoform X4 [Paramacrobiotus metropolitanus]|nr:uncharacterized protein LOC129598456 isoform X4 [Paramacrobiotus metropolitanus]
MKLWTRNKLALRWLSFSNKMGNSGSVPAEHDSDIYGEKYCSSGKDYEFGHTYIYSIDYFSGYTGSRKINCGKMGNSSSDENGTVTLDIKGAQSRPDSAIYGEKYTGGKDYESGHTYIYSIDYLSGYTGSQKVRHHFIVVEVPNNEFVIYQWRVAGKDYSYFVTNRLNATKCKYIGYFSVREVCNTVARVDGKHKYERTTFDCNDFANEVARLLNGNEYGVSLWCGDCR